MIDRRRGLALEWSGGEPGAVSIVIVYSSLGAGAGTAACVCVAPDRARSFTVAARYLSNLPPAEGLDARAAVTIVSMVEARNPGTVWAAGVHA